MGVGDEKGRDRQTMKKAEREGDHRWRTPTEAVGKEGYRIPAMLSDREGGF